MQRSVAKFTKNRAMLLDGQKDSASLSQKQKDGLTNLFQTPIFMVFLPRSQSIAPPSWVARYVRVTDDGGREVTCRRGRPQLIKLVFESSGDFVKGGTWKLSGPNLEPSKIQCVAFSAAQPADTSHVPWCLDQYEDADDTETDQEPNPDDDALDESEDEDMYMHAPAGFENHNHENEMCSGSEVEDQPDEMAWQGDVANHEKADNEEAPEDDEAAPIHRPRSKHMSPEWLCMVTEGFIDKLPHVKGSTIGRHASSGAWSARYPAISGLRHFARHFGEQRTPMSALLQCMVWLVEQHLDRQQDESFAVLAEELKARLEACFQLLGFETIRSSQTYRC